MSGFVSIRHSIIVRISIQRITVIIGDFVQIADGVAIEIVVVGIGCWLIGVFETEETLLGSAIHFVANVLVVTALDGRCPCPLFEVVIRVRDLNEVSAASMTIPTKELVTTDSDQIRSLLNAIDLR